MGRNSKDSDVSDVEWFGKHKLEDINISWQAGVKKAAKDACKKVRCRPLHHRRRH